MAHFVKLNDDNLVIDGVVVANDALDSLNEEQSGIEFLTNLYGYSNWKQTSFNARARGNYAGIGYTYLPLEDIFMPPKCHAEAVLNAKSAKWDCDNEEHNVKPLAE